MRIAGIERKYDLVVPEAGCRRLRAKKIAETHQGMTVTARPADRVPAVEPLQD